MELKMKTKLKLRKLKRIQKKGIPNKMNLQNRRK